MNNNNETYYQTKLAKFEYVVPNSFMYVLHNDFYITFDTIGFSTVENKSYFYKIYYMDILFPDENPGILFQIKNYFYAFSRNLMTKGKTYQIGKALTIEAQQKDKNPYLKCSLKIRDEEEIIIHDFYLDRAECSTISDSLHQVIIAHKEIFTFKQGANR